MAKVLIDDSTLQNMANTIRQKTGSSETMKPSEMVTEVGGLAKLNNQAKSVTPTTSSQLVQADSGYTGLSSVTVNAVTSSIDNNITAHNIKNGVTILGVEGTYEGTAPTGTISITENGTYNVSNYASADVEVQSTGTQNIVFIDDLVAGGTSISGLSLSIKEINSINGTPYTCTRFFVGLNNLEKIAMSVFQNAIINICNAMYYGCTKLENLPNMNTQQCTNFYQMAYNCRNLKDVPVYNMAAAASIGNMFYNCNSLTNNSLYNILESLKTITDTYTGNRTLSTIGLNSTQITYCTSLSNWQDLVALGWSAS